MTLSLAPEHVEDLRKSGLTDATIQAAGIRSIPPNDLPKRIAESLGYFPKATRSAYEIPYRLNGATGHSRIKLFPAPPDKDGGSTKYLSPKGGGSHLYFAPQLNLQILEDTTTPLYLIEGEKKCLRAIQEGMAAIGFSGVWSWQKDGAALKDFEHVKFDSRQVSIVPDSDTFTRGDADLKLAIYCLGKELESRGADVLVIVIPPALDGKKQGFDDYLLQCTVEEFSALTSVTLGAAVFEGLEDRWRARKERKRDLPEIDANDQNIPSITALVWSAIQKSNEHQPSLFRFGELFARIEPDANDNLRIKTLDEDQITHEVARRVNFFKANSKGIRIPAQPPQQAIRKGIMASPQKLLPALRRIVTAPVFAPDGTLIVDPGFCERCRTFYVPSPGLIIPPIPEVPTDADLKEAKRLILGELLFDFPLQGEADIAHTVALLILPAVRDMIDGPTPLHGVDAPVQGAGKGLLAEVICGVFAGNDISVMTEGRDEDEWRKRIFSTLRGAPNVVIIDNLKWRLESGALESALTARFVEDRVLGMSKNASVPVNAVWLVTGNNIAVGSEIARRFVRIRISPSMDEPWLRQDFKHKDLRAWARANRGQLVWAALVMARSWMAAGRPVYAGEKLGSFESWSEIIGGILAHAEIKGFLSNLRTFYRESDSENINFRNFVAAWHETFIDREVGVADLFDLAQQAGLELGKGGDRSAKTRLGFMLGKIRDRFFSGSGEAQYVVRRIEGRVVRGSQMWKLEAQNVGPGPF